MTNLQLELLKIFSFEPSQEQLIEIKALLSNYFADKATAEMDRLWEKHHWTDKTMTAWANEHMRTNHE